ncbi:MAG: tetratricopeptide repeat protein [Saprospiraceae bacterium]|nr:tetratricopeptide repeat protein [Saprospiraceae bacterium]
MRSVYLLLIAFFLLSIGWYCRVDQPQSEQTFQNLEEGVGYVGMQTCRSCHDNIHQTFIHTGMGQSFGKATLQKTAAHFGPDALVYDEALDFYYYPFFRDSNMYVLEFRLEGSDTVHQRIEQIDYIIGSGHHTNSHLINQNGYFYQAPITYYTQEERWDLAPGFDQGANLRFSRYLSSECITCHNYFPEPVIGSINKYASMPTGIECERCHGPGEIHVREKLAGNMVDTSQFADYTIVNPKRLPRDLQMDLCQRCHLQGLAILEPGKTFYDFRPGMALTEVMNVYLARYSDSHERFIMASQADRIRLSQCFKESEMTCITCHNPHQSVREFDQTAQFNKACQSCHDTNCSAAFAERQAENNNCIHCHMPPSASIDIPHINITDHYISRDNIRGQKKEGAQNQGPPKFLGLQALTKKNPTPLDMATAYLALYEKYVPAEIMLDSARYYINRADREQQATFPALVQYYYLREAYDSITLLKLPSTPLDAWTDYRIGEAFYQQGDAPQALKFFNQACDLQALNLEFLEKRGLAEALVNKPEEAKETFQLVLSENPNRPIAHCNLGYLLVVSGDLEGAARHYQKAIALDPDYEQALLNMAALRLQQNRKPEALKLLDRVLKKNPANQQASAARELILR